MVRALGCLALCCAMFARAEAEPAGKLDKQPARNDRRIVTGRHRPPAAVPSLGSQTAPVTIEFFCNFGDGTKSAQVDRLLTQLQERHPRRLRILYRLVGSGKQSIGLGIREVRRRGVHTGDDPRHSAGQLPPHLWFGTGVADGLAPSGRSGLRGVDANENEPIAHG